MAMLISEKVTEIKFMPNVSRNREPITTNNGLLPKCPVAMELVNEMCYRFRGGSPFRARQITNEGQLENLRNRPCSCVFCWGLGDGYTE